MSTSTITRRLVFSILLGLTTAAVTAAQDAQPSAQQVPPIRNFLKINDQFCTGGQPRMEHLDQLKAEGVKAIINLRTPGEHRADEEEANRWTSS
jgi:hypothetical protein